MTACCLVVGVVDPGEDRPGLDRLPFVERQFDDAGLDRLEAEDALVRLDVAGDDDRVRVGLPLDPGKDDVPPPRDDNVLVTIGGETAETQHRNHKKKEGETPHRQEPTPLASPFLGPSIAREPRGVLATSLARGLTQVKDDPSSHAAGVRSALRRSAPERYQF